MVRRMDGPTSPDKATGEDTRRQNLRLALRIAYQQGATTRAEIARLTGLTRATASTIVRELVDDGYLVEMGAGESTGGKPPTLYEFRAEARTIVTLDLSRQPFTGALHDLRGTVLDHQRVRRDGLTGDDAVAAALDLAASLCREAATEVIGIGVGAPGLVDGDGCVHVSANLGWRDVPLAHLLRERLGTPAHVGNDTSLAALAEYGRQGAAFSNLMLVEISDGIGAGIVLNGAIHVGEAAAAGEIGHLVAVPGGELCTCGNRGCLETVAGIPAIVAAAGVGSAADLARTTPAIDAAVLNAATHVGDVLAAAVGILDVHRIVLAGPLAGLAPDFAEAVRTELAARVLPAVAEDITVLWTKLGDDIVLHGAALHVLRGELGLPW